jgi:hypothetical protein
MEVNEIVHRSRYHHNRMPMDAFDHTFPMGASHCSPRQLFFEWQPENTALNNIGVFCPDLVFWFVRKRIRLSLKRVADI